MKTTHVPSFVLAVVAGAFISSPQTEAAIVNGLSVVATRGFPGIGTCPGTPIRTSFRIGFKNPIYHEEVTGQPGLKSQTITARYDDAGGQTPGLISTISISVTTPDGPLVSVSVFPAVGPATVTNGLGMRLERNFQGNQVVVTAGPGLPIIEGVTLLGSFPTEGQKTVTLHAEFVLADAASTKLEGEDKRDGVVVKVVIAPAGPRYDRVVSAKDTALGMPGGTMNLDVTVTPAGAKIRLFIRRIAGKFGSAHFAFTDSGTLVLTGAAGGNLITINGGDVSDQPRNMQVQHRSGLDPDVPSVVCSSFDFTVFRVDPKAYVSGSVKNALPATAAANGGLGPRTLLENYLEATLTNTPLGNSFFPLLAYGGIVIRGKIVPSNMDRTDFHVADAQGNPVVSRPNAFNWDRRASSRNYGKHCLRPDPNPEFVATENLSDDLGDGRDEDLQPDPDGDVGQLYIWSYDVVRRLSTDIPNDGDVERVRIQFVETAQYAGISVSPRLNWFWRISYINPPPINRPPHPPIDLKFLPLNDVANDNVLEAARYKPNKNTLVLVSDATTLLTLDLKQSTVPQGFMVAGSGPGTATRGPANVLWTIDGAMLDAGAPCQPYAYMVREQSGETDGDRTIIPFNITNSTATRLSGNYSVPNGALLGEYTIYVFLRDAVRISPNRTVIMDP